MAYRTIQGDTWDKIAKSVYGEEVYAGQLMAANRKLLDFFVFPSGVVVETPEINKESTDFPPWRRG